MTSSKPPSTRPPIIDDDEPITLNVPVPPLTLPGEKRLPESPKRPASERIRARTTPPALEPVHDAWTTDRMARESGFPPPSSSPRPPSRPSGLGSDRARARLGLDRSTRPLPNPEHDGDALSLVDTGTFDLVGTDLRTEMTDRFALGDFTGALRFAELALGSSGPDEEAERVARDSRSRLEQIHSSRLGPLNRVPRLAVHESEVRWLGLERQSSQVLSYIDGVRTVLEVIEASGLSRLDALRTLSDLLQVGAIEIDTR